MKIQVKIIVFLFLVCFCFLDAKFIKQEEKEVDETPLLRVGDKPIKKTSSNLLFAS
jgi:hypothetical protein